MNAGRRGRRWRSQRIGGGWRVDIIYAGARTVVKREERGGRSGAAMAAVVAASGVALSW
jgi:hypothetical protein